MKVPGHRPAADAEHASGVAPGEVAFGEGSPCAPGNPGIREIAACHAETDYLALAKHLGVDLTVVGPEAPMVAETSIWFPAAQDGDRRTHCANAALRRQAKSTPSGSMQKLGLPTARFATAASIKEAEDALRHFATPVVLKTDAWPRAKAWRSPESE